MQVRVAAPTLVTNTEVFDLLQTRRRARSKIKHEVSQDAEGPNTRECKWIEAKVMKYLRQQHCDHQSRASVAATLKQLEPFDVLASSAGEHVNGAMTQAEKLQLINIAARSPVDVHLVVEDCVDRFEEHHVEELCSVIANNLWDHAPSGRRRRLPSNEDTSVLNGVSKSASPIPSKTVQENADQDRHTNKKSTNKTQRGKRRSQKK